MKAFLISLGIILGACFPSHACSCLGGNAADLYESSDAVFMGQPISKPKRARPTIRFKVKKAWKAEKSSTIDIEHSGDAMMCGLNDLFRGSSIVFARRTQHGDYVSGLCSVFKATDELVEALEAKHFDTHGGQSSGSN